MDISTIGCAAHCRLDNGNFSELRLAFGVAAPTSIRCQHAEQTAQNAPLNLQTLEAISESVLQDVAPRSSWRASKEFRLHLIQTMTKKVISEAVAAGRRKIIMILCGNKLPSDATINGMPPASRRCGPHALKFSANKDAKCSSTEGCCSGEWCLYGVGRRHSNRQLLIPCRLG